LCCIILACCAIGTAIEISQESFQNGKEDHYFAAQNGTLKHEKDQGESSFSHEIPKVTDVTETTPLLRANKKQNGKNFFNYVHLPVPFMFTFLC
jgi:hypothetical protein